MPSGRQRSPGVKLGISIFIAAILSIPLLLVYALNWDRQQQAETANNSITQGWGGPQTVAGPVLVIPYEADSVETVTENGQERTRTVRVNKELFVSPLDNKADATLLPDYKRKSIYVSVLYTAAVKGRATFALPADLARFGVTREQLKLDRAELRFGVSDARGLQAGSTVRVAGRPIELQPGKGVAATNGSGFFAFVTWDGLAPLDVAYDYKVNGSRSFGFVPRGGNTSWTFTSKWPSPSFGGNFLPVRPEVSSKGFTARYGIPNLALGQALVSSEDTGPPPYVDTASYDDRSMMSATVVSGNSGQSQVASIGLIEPVNVYSQVNRAVKYGFLFIGFTFLAFLMFDIVGGARVAAAEYLLTGVGLVLFFVLLLAFAEVVGFAVAYLIAGGAIVGLLTAYSAAVLGGRKRAGFIGALLTGLYALLYVLLSLEAYSLLIGSVLLFVALAGVMWATRRIDWSGVGRTEAEEDAVPVEA